MAYLFLVKARMATNPESLNDVARAIQLALAPVFLLTGIAGLLNVMAGRLARIIDRGRGLTERPVAVKSSERDFIHRELQSLARRRHFTNIAITAATIAALLLCVVIASLFLDVILHAPLNWLVGTLFTASTMALIVSLTFFLREVHLAMQTGRFKFLRQARTHKIVQPNIVKRSTRSPIDPLIIYANSVEDRTHKNFR